MIYAVNKRTKEHRAISENTRYGVEAWRYVEADADGWIEWHGGECPLPINAAHKIKMRDGEISKLDDEANSWCWKHHGGKGDIIAYRPVLDADTKVAHPGTLAGPDKYRVPGGEWPEPPAWSGEGLPPVGCECKLLRWRGGWDSGKVLYVGDEFIVMLVGGKELIVGTCNTFRPLRSEEDRSVDEMMGIWSNTASIFAADGMRALYRAGYRKQGGEA